MKNKIQARKITIFYQNIKTQFDQSISLDYYYNKISQKFKLNKDLITLGIGLSLYDDGTHTLRIFFYFKNKRHIVRLRQYFSFIVDHPCEGYTSTNKSKELDLIMKMTNSRCWGDTGLKTKLEAIHIENEINKGRTPVMFFDLEESSLRHLLYHSPTKIERFSRYKQLYNHIVNLRSKPRIFFDIKKVWEYGKNPDLNYTFQSLSQLIDILSFLNNHAVPNDRAYKAQMLHLWSNTPGLGKSSIINLLRTSSPCYRWPDDNWFEHYENNLYQWILWDEFRLTGQSSEFLKRFFAGDQMTLPVKGSHSYKRDNPLVILTSNFSLEAHTQRKVSNKQQRKIELNAFQARIHEIELKYPIINCEFNLWLTFMQNCLFTLEKS